MDHQDVTPPVRRLKRKASLLALVAITPVLPMGLAGCPCGCTQAPPFTPYYAQSIAVGDFNSDGALDLAVGTFRNHENSAASDSVVSLVLQNRNSPGTFQSGLDIQLPIDPLAVSAADLDGTGSTDLVMAGIGSAAGNVVSLLQTSAPSGPLAAPTAITSGVERGTNVVIADLNSDGAPDIAIADDFRAGNVTIVFQSPTVPGQFSAPITLATGNKIMALAAGDIDGDTRTDLAVVVRDSNGQEGRIELFLANNAGLFSPRVDIPVTMGPSSIALGDLNGDGRLDIAINGENINRVAVLLQSATTRGTFGSPTLFTSGNYPTTVALADVNADGRLDVVTANYFSNSVSVLLQSAGGALSQSVNYALESPPAGIAISDLNGDGFPDLAVAAGNRATVLLNSRATPGTFAAGRQVGG